MIRRLTRIPDLSRVVRLHVGGPPLGLRAEDEALPRWDFSEVSVVEPGPVVAELLADHLGERPAGFGQDAAMHVC